MPTEVQRRAAEVGRRAGEKGARGEPRKLNRGGSRQSEARPQAGAETGAARCGSGRIVSANGAVHRDGRAAHAAARERDHVVRARAEGRLPAPV